MADETPASSGGGGTITRILTLLAMVAIGANVVVLQAFGGTLVERWPPEVGAVLVALAVLALVFVVPVAGGGWALRQLRARGVKIRLARTLAGLVGLFNVALCAATWWLSPQPVPELLVERGTWMIDVATGQGPFGPAAVPVAETLLAEARTHDSIAALAPLLTDEGAAAVATYWLVMLHGTGGSNADLEALHRRYHIDIEALRSAPAAAQLEDGRSLLVDLAGVMDAATKDQPEALRTAPTFQWPADLPETLEVRVIDRTHLGIATRSWEARYEGGEWRLWLGDVATWASLAEARLIELQPVLLQWQASQAERDAVAAAALEALGGAPPPPAPTGTPAPAPADPEAFAKVRSALEAAAKGRYGAIAGTTAFNAGWPDALTREAAVTQAELVRAWCVPAAGDDPLVAKEHQALLVRYGLASPEAAAEPPTDGAAEAPADGATEVVAPEPAVVALEDAQRTALEARGRRWLADVLVLCEPVVVMRQHRDVGPGGAPDDGRRARWAQLDAADWVSSAKLSENGGAVTVEVSGQTVKAVEQDGAWRVSW